jgi:hypothetical protein
MVGETFDLLGRPFPGQRLEGLDDPGMEHAPSLLEQTAIRDLMREGVREGIFEIRKQPGLVKELGGLEAVEPATETFVLEVGGRLEERERDVLADDRGDLQETFVFGGKPVDARRQYCLDRGRRLDRLHGLRQPIPSSLSCQCLRLHQRPDGLLQEEGVPAPDQEPLEGCESGIVSKECIEQFPGTLGREGVEPHLRVGRLVAPGVPVLGAVVHEQE